MSNASVCNVSSDDTVLVNDFSDGGLMGSGGLWIQFLTSDSQLIVHLTLSATVRPLADELLL